jgi:hypothetical protein
MIESIQNISQADALSAVTTIISIIFGWKYYGAKGVIKAVVKGVEDFTQSDNASTLKDELKNSVTKRAEKYGVAKKVFGFVKLFTK